MLLRTFALATLVGLMGCTSAPIPANTTLDMQLTQITNLLVGDYASHADDGAREGRPIYLRIRPITPPDGHDYALYSEMRHDGPDGEFYRQIVYLFDENSERSENRMRAIRLADGAAAASLLTDPNAFKNGKIKTRPALSEACYAAWTRVDTGYESWIDPERCVITGKRGDRRRIEARTRITPFSIDQLERGYSLEGKLLFGNSDDTLYMWPRLETSDSD